MNAHTRAEARLVRLVSAACVLALILAIGLWWIFTGAPATRITAYFGESVGIYPGSDVRLLGVKVSSVSAVRPAGQQVEVDLTVDPGVRLPATVGAVIVAASLVADRYVQLTPVYRGGARLASGAVIPRARTATPVEIDQIYGSLNTLAGALGPDGANSTGALSNLLNVGAANLAGNGQNLYSTLTDLSQAAQALSGSRGDLFGTVDNLQRFAAALAQSNQQVHDFDTRLADVSGFLAGERSDLAAALNQLAPALAGVQGFIQDNRTALKSNVDNLARITQVLVTERSALAELLDVAPVTAANMLESYDAASGSLTGRPDLNELSSPPIVTICRLIRQSTPTALPQALANACDALAPVVSGTTPLPSTAQVLGELQNGTPVVPLPLVSSASTGSGR